MKYMLRFCSTFQWTVVRTFIYFNITG